MSERPKSDACPSPPRGGGDRAWDLAIGAPYKDVSGAADAGLVHVVYGAVKAELLFASHQLWTQGGAGLLDQPEAGDPFGAALAASDFNGGGLADLAVGAPGENQEIFKPVSSTTPDVGRANVVYGSATGLSAVGSQLLQRGQGGLAGTPFPVRALREVASVTRGRNPDLAPGFSVAADPSAARRSRECRPGISS